MNIIEAPAEESKNFFLKGTSYFGEDLPKYIDFENILHNVDSILSVKDLKSLINRPENHTDLNYSLISNKDGRFSWRPFELIHPVSYVNLVNIICSEDNWNQLIKRLNEFKCEKIECHSIPIISGKHKSDKSNQIIHWWQKIEQKSITQSLCFNHMIHTDVTDCYGSIYTHSIPWAVHGIDIAKRERNNKTLLGNEIDKAIQNTRYGQTNGIPQGSSLMDFISEIVLGWVDLAISNEIYDIDYKILRYRDDYRIFTNNDTDGDIILKVISDKLRITGMKLGTSKTIVSENIITGSVKADKIAALELVDSGYINANTVQKQLLRLHSFGRKFPNSGSLKKLLNNYHKRMFYRQIYNVDDSEILIAIAVDIGATSPQAFPAVAGILSKIMNFVPTSKKKDVWEKITKKMHSVPYNGYLEIWLQRITKNTGDHGLDFDSDEKICKIVNGEKENLWNSDWINHRELKNAVMDSNIVHGDPNSMPEIIHPDEIKLFSKNDYKY